MIKQKNIIEALKILEAFGLPRAQRNERSALCLLALLNLTPDKTWTKAENPLTGITPIMNFSRKNYGKEYAPNTREIFRRQTMHQFVAAGIALYTQSVLILGTAANPRAKGVYKNTGLGAGAANKA